MRLIVIALFAMFFVVVAPTAAHAADATTTSFVASSPVTAAFGSDWSVVVAVARAGENRPVMPVSPTMGTVDIYVKGVSGAYVTALPLQPDGRAFFTQPDDRPLLAAGDHEITAIFTPDGGSQLVTSQTATPLILTITPQQVSATVAIQQDAAVSPFPIITAALGGDYVTENGGSPSGTWSFTVTDSAKTVVFDEDFALPFGSTEPLRVEVDSRLAAGEKFTVNAEFTPVEELAGGLEVATPPSAMFSTPGSTFGDAISSRLAFPWWAVLGVGGLLVALVATVIILGVKLSKTAPKAAPALAGATAVPGDPQNVELMSWDEAGIPEESSRKVPESTTWLLSDIDPAIDGVDDEPVVTAADAPTERLATNGPEPVESESPESSPEGESKP